MDHVCQQLWLSAGQLDLLAGAEGLFLRHEEIIHLFIGKG